MGWAHAPALWAEADNKKQSEPVVSKERSGTAKIVLEDGAEEKPEKISTEPQFSEEQRVALAVGVFSVLALEMRDKLKNGEFRNTTQGEYLTEYNYQSMLASINPLSLNDYGYDGSGINVSVVDSGIDSAHPEFDGKIIQGYDFANSSSGFAADENGHGTHVASIIAGERDGSGMRGVAYDANLFSYKVDNDGDIGFEALSTDEQIASVFSQNVADDIDVSNNSWGSGTSVTDVSTAYVTTNYASSIAAAKAAQANGTLFVFSTGNDTSHQPDLVGGLPYHDTDLKDAWLVVTAVDSDLTETGYTNRCGVAYDFCVTAPGGGDDSSTDGILAAEANTGGYTRISGTSMAAPHVSGLAAALMEKFPTLTPAQIATRIKTTASLEDLTGLLGETLAVDGETVMQEIFGYGLVDAEAASSTIGTLVFPMGGSAGGGTPVGTNPLPLPAAISGSVSEAILNDRFIVFDTFDGATFEVDGDQLFESQSTSFAPHYNLPNASSKNGALSKATQGFTYSYNDTGNATALPLVWGSKAGFFDPAPFVVPTSQHQMGWATSLDGMQISSFVSSDVINGSASSLSKVGVTAVVPTTSKLNMSLAYFSGDSVTDFGYFTNKISKTKTDDLEFGAQYAVSSSDNVFARYAMTKFSDIETTTLSFGAENLSADSMSFGYEIVSPKSSITFGIKSDFTLVDGSLSMALPSSVDASGNVASYDERRYSVKPRRTFDPYLTYLGELGKNTHWQLGSHLNGDDYSSGSVRLEISSRF